MAENQHRVRSKVLAGIIAGIIVAIVVALGKWIWPSLGPLLSHTWSFLKLLSRHLVSLANSKVTIPIWLLGVLVIGSLLFVAVVVLVLLDSRRARLTWKDYRTDTFHDMVWRWGYGSTPSEVEGLCCFCPHDDTQLVYSEEYDRTSFVCETCHKRFGPVPGDRFHVLSMVTRQIHRKLRTGGWVLELRRRSGQSS